MSQSQGYSYWKSNLLYARYLLRHKWFVLRAGMACGAPLWRLLIHDWSKLGRREWPQYRNYFYPPRQPEGMMNAYKLAFDEAWQHHILYNPHHWEHWQEDLCNGTFITHQIPEHFVREMVADWWGAGRAIQGKWEAVDWFIDHSTSIQLHPQTRQRVVQILDRSARTLEGVAACR